MPKIVHCGLDYSGGEGSGGASSISDLNDVELTDLFDGEILKYDATEEKWVNAEYGGSSGAIGSDMSIKHANWVATSSSATGTVVTETLTLDAGEYLIVATTPVANGTNSDQNFAIKINDIIDWNTNGTAPLTYGNYVKRINLSSTSAVCLVTGFSASVSWQSQYFSRGGMDIIRLSQLSPIIYSTEEREVGVWTDGKPLYQKTINFGELPNNSAKSVAHGISNIDKIVDISGETTNPSNNVTLALQYGYPSVNGKITTSINADRTNLTLITGDNLTGYTYTYLTLQYTKTTDVPGSGQYTTLGVPAVHYSTDEQVIGTWIDGKTLYEKTVDCGALLNNATKTVAHDIANISKVVECKGISFDTSGTSICLPYVGFSDWSVSIYADATNIYLQTKQNRTNFVNSYITLRYTKTTD